MATSDHDGIDDSSVYGGVDDSFSRHMSMIASTHDVIDDSFDGQCR